jgi:hypothetical protein
MLRNVGVRALRSSPCGDDTRYRGGKYTAGGKRCRSLVVRRTAMFLGNWPPPIRWVVEASYAQTTVGTRQATRLSLRVYIAAPNVGSSTVVGSCAAALKEDRIADRLAEVSAIRCNEFGPARPVWRPRSTGAATFTTGWDHYALCLNGQRGTTDFCSSISVMPHFFLHSRTKTAGENRQPAEGEHRQRRRFRN